MSYYYKDLEELLKTASESLTISILRRELLSAKKKRRYWCRRVKELKLELDRLTDVSNEVINNNSEV